MGNLNAILAFQIAHIILGSPPGHQVRLQRPPALPLHSVFERIPMHHTDADNAAAAKKAMELLSVKELADGQQYFGLYLQQLRRASRALKALNEPMIGDGLDQERYRSTFWLAGHDAQGPQARYDRTSSSRQPCRSPASSASTPGPIRSSRCTPPLSRSSRPRQDALRGRAGLSEALVLQTAGRSWGLGSSAFRRLCPGRCHHRAGNPTSLTGCTNTVALWH